MKKLISGLLFLALIIAIVLYASGALSGDQVEPGRAAEPPGPPAPAETTTADRGEVDVWEDAVGTVESRTVVSVEAQVTGLVREVHADAGAKVKAGTPLIVLDGRILRARLAQAQEGLEQAKASKRRAEQSRRSGQAALDRAKKYHERMQVLVQDQTVTDVEAESAEASWLQAEAGVAEADAAITAAEAAIQQAVQGVEAAQFAVGHTKIATPLDGVVALKNVEPGDLAWPGKTLFEILDPGDLRLEAQVREGLISHVKPGDELHVSLPALGRTVEGTVAEVCPTANPKSRTFRVRVDFDHIPGIHPGMFGRLRIPLGSREVVRISKRAVRTTGQLESVLMQIDDGAGKTRWARRLVTIGRSLGDGTVEVLSGLKGGETVGLAEAD